MFHEGGLVAEQLVARRQCTLTRGMVVVAEATVHRDLGVLCARWLRQAVATPGAVAAREGTLADLPTSHRNLLDAKRRRLQKAGRASLSAAPRCVKCALGQTGPWKNRMRFSMAQTVVATAAAVGDPAVVELARAAMLRRGDGVGRLKEFDQAVARAQRGRPVRWPCSARTNVSDGLWCPLGGDVLACATERGVTVPGPDPTPADMWSLAPATRR